MKRCRYCHRALWTTIFGPCCEYCDRMDLWPNTAGDVTILDTSECRNCHRRIVLASGVWVDPEATGDDSVWRETCDRSETFTAEHEPSPTNPRRSQLQRDCDDIIRGTVYDWEQEGDAL